MTVALIIGGLMLLILGGELLVRGASRVAADFGIPALIIGLTVVAFGTSAPELAVSVRAAISGDAAIAVGNVVGSNIFNVLFILGLSALVAPLVVSSQLLRFELPLMIVVSCVVMVMALDGAIGRLDGLILCAALAGWLVMLALMSRGEACEASSGEGAVAAPGLHRHAINVALIVVGLALLVLGARWLVEGAVTLARLVGVSELVIGLTVVAAGTSLPEVVTSLVASVRGERDIAVGNVVGSNLFNMLAVLGISSLVAADGLAVSDSALRFDLPVMIGVAIACLPIFLTGGRIERWEGGLFFAYYIAYTTWVVLAATGHAALAPFSAAIGLFVLPLTAVTLIVLALRAARTRAA